MLEALKSRRTAKVLGSVDAPEKSSDVKRDQIDDLLLAAGNAPFHYPCDRAHLGAMSSPVPWRACKLDKSACLALMNKLVAEENPTKIPNMLAAADYLIQVTWLPDVGTILPVSKDKNAPQFHGTLRNMEHIAAASAFVQSLLLAAGDAGFATYWSSGGALRSSEIFNHMGIAETEILLGSVFLFPSETQNSEIKPGSWSDKRGGVADWSFWFEIQ